MIPDSDRNPNLSWVASRRSSKELIFEGHTKVDPAKDVIYVKGKRLPKKFPPKISNVNARWTCPRVLCYYSWTGRLSPYLFQGTTKNVAPISEIQLYRHALHDMLISYKLKQVSVDTNDSKTPFIRPWLRHKMEGLIDSDFNNNKSDLLSKIHHPNTIALGYYIHWETRFLVYELMMEKGSLENQLREFLHEHGNLPVIHSDLKSSTTSDLKSSNVLLDSNFNGKSKSSASSKQLGHTAAYSQNTEDAQETLIEHIPELKGPIFAIQSLFNGMGETGELNAGGRTISQSNGINCIDGTVPRPAPADKVHSVKGHLHHIEKEMSKLGEKHVEKEKRARFSNILPDK
ncbi:putative receptor-like protein, partial [Drosera capensis]